MDKDLAKLKRVNTIVLRLRTSKEIVLSAEEQALIRWFIKGKVKRHPDIDTKWNIVRQNIKARLSLLDLPENFQPLK